MSLVTIIELSAAALGLFSGVFFCVGVLHVKDSTLECIATSMWGKGEIIAKELALQRVDFTIGAYLLFLSFLVQVVGKCLPSGLALAEVTSSAATGAAVSLAGPVLLLALLYLPWRAGRAKVARSLEVAVKGKQ